MRAPSNKWLSALITGLGAIATMYVVTESWDKEESIALIGLIVERGVAYFTPNRPPVINPELGDAA